jgi:hypothetical protein
MFDIESLDKSTRREGRQSGVKLEWKSLKEIERLTKVFGSRNATYKQKLATAFIIAVFDEANNSVDSLNRYLVHGGIEPRNNVHYAVINGRRTIVVEDFNTFCLGHGYTEDIINFWQYLSYSFLGKELAFYHKGYGITSFEVRNIDGFVRRYIEFLENQQPVSADVKCITSDGADDIQERDECEGEIGELLTALMEYA